MTESLLAIFRRLAELHAKAASGPWRVDPDGVVRSVGGEPIASHSSVRFVDDGDGYTDDCSEGVAAGDADFMVAAKNALNIMLAYRRQIEPLLAAVDVQAPDIDPSPASWPTEPPKEDGWYWVWKPHGPKPPGATRELGHAEVVLVGGPLVRDSGGGIYRLSDQCNGWRWRPGRVEP